MSGAITALIPVPRRASLGGVPVSVWEARLSDLADLQAILDDAWDDPGDTIRDRLAAVSPASQGGDGPAESSGRWSMIVDAWEAAESGPPVYGEGSANDFYATDRGVCLFLWIALRRGNPGLTPERVVELAGTMSPSEYGRVWRIFHGVRSARMLLRMLTDGLSPPSGGQGSGPVPPWGQAIDDLVRDRPGWTYADVYAMTLTEYLNARRHGEPEESGIAVPAGMDPGAFLAEMERRTGRAYGANASEPP